MGRSLGQGLCCPCPHWRTQAMGMAMHCASRSGVGRAGTRWQRVWSPRPCSPLHPAPGPPKRPCQDTKLHPPGRGDAGPGSGPGLSSRDPGSRRTKTKPLPKRYRIAGYAGSARLVYGNTGGGKTRKDGPWPLWKWSPLEKRKRPGFAFGPAPGGRLFQGFFRDTWCLSKATRGTSFS